MNSIKILVNSFDKILPGNSIPSSDEPKDLSKNETQLSESEAITETDGYFEQLPTNEKTDGYFEQLPTNEKTDGYFKELPTSEEPRSDGKGDDNNNNSVKKTNSISLEEKADGETRVESDDGEGDDDVDDDNEMNLTTPVSQQVVSLSPAIAFLYTLWRVIYFFPNYLIIKPGSFVIKILIYPFVMIKVSLGFGKKPVVELTPFDEKENTFESNDREDESLVTRTSSPNTTKSQQPQSQRKQRQKQRSQQQSQELQDQEEYNDDEKLEQLKRDSIIANEVKSPTFFSKYIIPPPVRLYPLSRNPQKKRRKKILILDLDETLIHSLSRGSPRSFHPASHSKMIEIRINNISSLYYVHKRPFCDYFLTEISKWFELQIFTASVKEYADPIINWLEEEILNTLNKQTLEERKNASNCGGGGGEEFERPKIFTKRYYRNNCSYRPGVGYIKDLSKFIREDDLKNVMILDNSPISYALHEDNAISIEGWINDQNDRDLLNLLPLLRSLSLCIDVRFILGLKNGEKVFES
ncbi:NEM1 [Candida oxycetoniae]|uniref:Mitochondrial import inner membrane translocase subunit TIM50 n=1 Tax=Candida oxycetoniae TaxID=497107 RepID=A0AAI9STH3_9ASCO|nr:NEM1 [Candida oxycetoniae]KAI3402735.2 NEM1 [Candida oxycetoniae]